MRSKWRKAVLVALWVGVAFVGVLMIPFGGAWVDALQVRAMFPGLLAGGLFARAGFPGSTAFVLALLVSYLSWFLIVWLAVWLWGRARGAQRASS